MNARHRIGMAFVLCLTTATFGFFAFRYMTNEGPKTVSKGELVDDTEIRNEILTMLVESQKIDFRNTDSERIRSFCHDLDRVYAVFGPVEGVFGKTNYSFVRFSDYPISACIWDREGVLVSMELIGTDDDIGAANHDR